MVEAMLQSRSALIGRSLVTDTVRITPVETLDWAAITVRRGQRAALAQRLGDAFGLTLPEGPGACFAGSTTLLWSGSDRYTLLTEAVGEATQAVGDAADVTGLTGSQAIIAIEGTGARDVLGRLVAIDLHPRVFRPGSAASTLLGHFGVTLWQTSEAPVYRLSCYRSYADALWHAVQTASGLR